MFESFKGFGLTFGQMFKKVFTEQYPYEVKPTEGDLRSTIQKRHCQCREGLIMLSLHVSIFPS